MSSHARAIVALLKIVENKKASVRRRIEACEALLSYEAPQQVVDNAKVFLTRVFEDIEHVNVDDRLMAAKLMRRASAAKVTQATVRSTTPDAEKEIFRDIEMAGRRMRLDKAGLWKMAPPDWADDLLGDDYVAPIDRDYNDVFEGK